MSSIDALPATFLRDFDVGRVRSRATARRGVMRWVSTRYATAPLTAAAEKDVPLHLLYPLAL